MRAAQTVAQSGKYLLRFGILPRKGGLFASNANTK
jgi:hypothetical protein